MSGLCRNLAVSLAAALLFTACTQVTEVVSARTIDVSGRMTLVLPSPRQVGSNIIATQVLTGTYGERRFSLQLELEWTEQEIVVVALGGFGTAVFTMRFDGERLETVGNEAVLNGLDVRYVLADLLMTWLDAATLRNLLVGEAVEVLDEPDRRTIVSQGLELIRIAYTDGHSWSGTVRFENVERGYSLEIRTISARRD